MKNKKLFIGIGIFLIVILLGIAIFFVVKNYNNNTFGDTNEDEAAVEGAFDTTTIKSNTFNSIKQDNIEATNIEINHFSNELQVVTTLKNNSNEAVEGFFIEIALVDADGNTVTSVAENSNEKIDPKGEITITNYVTELENGNSITNAKIVSLEKNIKNTLEDSFEEVEDSVQEDQLESFVPTKEEIKASVPVE